MLGELESPDCTRPKGEDSRSLPAESRASLQVPLPPTASQVEDAGATSPSAWLTSLQPAFSWGGTALRAGMEVQLIGVDAANAQDGAHGVLRWWSAERQQWTVALPSGEELQVSAEKLRIAEAPTSSTTEATETAQSNNSLLTVDVLGKSWCAVTHEGGMLQYWNVKSCRTRSWSLSELDARSSLASGVRGTYPALVAEARPTGGHAHVTDAGEEASAKEKWLGFGQDSNPEAQQDAESVADLGCI